jgi:penicillin-binding protein 2A
MSRPVAGKTGTTQLPATKEFEGIGDGSKDAWFVGYTPELVGAVWIGYDQTDRNHYLSTSGGYNPALVFKEMMSMALRDVPAASFKQPPQTGKGDNVVAPGKGKGDDKKEPSGQSKKNDKEENKRKEEKKKEQEKREKEQEKSKGRDDDDD